MSSGEAEYISAAVACMRASHLRMLINDLRFMGSENYNHDVVNLKLARIIIMKLQSAWPNAIKIQLVIDTWSEGIIMYDKEQLYKNINLNGLEQNIN